MNTYNEVSDTGTGGPLVFINFAMYIWPQLMIKNNKRQLTNYNYELEKPNTTRKQERPPQIVLVSNYNFMSIPLHIVTDIVI